MQIYRFDPEVGRPVARFGSRFIMSPILRTGGAPAPEAAAGAPATGAPAGAQIGCMHLPPGGLVGRHPATVPQLLLVVAGAGWVCGAGAEPTPIAPGQAAFWAAGEWHETGTATGLTAIVVEGETVNPAGLMRPA